VLARIVLSLVLSASVLTVACSSPATTTDDEIALPDREARRDSNETTPPPKSTKNGDAPSDAPGNNTSSSGGGGGGNGNATPTAVACEKPSTCGAATPICCGEVGLGEGSLPNCPIQAMKGTCATACPTSLTAACPVTQKTRLCGTGADCSADAPSCCHIDSNGFKASICVPSFFAPLLQENGTSCD